MINSKRGGKAGEGMIVCRYVNMRGLNSRFEGLKKGEFFDFTIGLMDT